MSFGRARRSKTVILLLRQRSGNHEIEQKKIVELESLLAMKLISFRRKDQVHVLDMIGVGLIDETWTTKFEPPLSERLQELLDDPDG